MDPQRGCRRCLLISHNNGQLKKKSLKNNNWIYSFNWNSIRQIFNIRMNVPMSHNLEMKWNSIPVINGKQSVSYFYNFFHWLSFRNINNFLFFESIITVHLKIKILLTSSKIPSHEIANLNCYSKQKKNSWEADKHAKTWNILSLCWCWRYFSYLYFPYFSIRKTAV